MAEQQMEANRLYPITLEENRVLLQAKTTRNAYQVVIKSNDLAAAISEAVRNAHYPFEEYWMPYIQWHYREEIAALLAVHGQIWAGKLTAGGWRGGNRIDGDVAGVLYTAAGIAAAKGQQQSFSISEACAGQHPAHACRVCGPGHQIVELEPNCAVTTNVVAYRGQIPTDVRARVRNYGSSSVVTRLSRWSA